MNTLFARPQTILSALCGLLVITLMYQLYAPAPEFNPAPEVLTWNSAARTLPAAFAMPPEQTFAAIDQRPIFNPTRAPIEVANDQGADAQGPPPAPLASLVGVILDGDTRLAIFHRQANEPAITLRTGSILDGWTISEVDADKVILGAGRTTMELRLGEAQSSQSESATSPNSSAPSVAPSGAIYPMSGASTGNRTRLAQPTFESNSRPAVFPPVGVPQAAPYSQGGPSRRFPITPQIPQTVQNSSATAPPSNATPPQAH